VLLPPKPVKRPNLRLALLPLLQVLDLTRHPLRYVLIALILVVVLGTFGVVFFLADPGSVGDLREDYVSREAYTFRTLRLDGPYITLEYTAGGAIIPVYSSGQVTGAVITGTGTVTFRAPPSSVGELAALVGDPHATALSDTVTGCYLPATYQELESIKELASAEVSHAYGTHLPEAEQILADVKRNPNLIMVFGQTRQFTEGAPVSTYFRTRSYGGVTFIEGSTVTLTVTSPHRVRVTFPNEFPFRSIFSPVSLQTPLLSGPLIAFGVMSFLLIALTYVLTIDLLHPRPQPRYLRGRSAYPASWDGTFVAVLLTGEMLVRLLVNLAQLRSEAVVIYQVLALVLIVYWLGFVGLDVPSYLGLTRRNLARVLFVGVTLGLLATLGGAVSFPSGLRSVRFLPAVLQVLWSFGFIGVVRALYYHGFLQTTLERHFGRWLGWLGSALVIALVYFLPGFLPAPGNPVTWPASVIGGLATLFLTFAVIGFLFHRTRSAWGAATVLGLLDFLPRVLTF
jgi:CRP-like cAMP-binding protein